ncbi:MAG: hypothetical protein KKA19_06845 [Candidatus Margulisbacteria bacterium]|nr:hypothetical protein [Candidatus Margulisiibacteriota bacterium]
MNMKVNRQNNVPRNIGLPSKENMGKILKGLAIVITAPLWILTGCKNPLAPSTDSPDPTALSKDMLFKVGPLDLNLPKGTRLLDDGNWHKVGDHYESDGIIFILPEDKPDLGLTFKVADEENSEKLVNKEIVLYSSHANPSATDAEKAIYVNKERINGKLKYDIYHGDKPYSKDWPWSIHFYPDRPVISWIKDGRSAGERQN